MLLSTIMHQYARLVKLCDDRGAARAQTGLGIGLCRVHPAARALGTCGLLDGDRQAAVAAALSGDGLGIDIVVLGDEALGNDEQLLKIHVLYLIDNGLALALGAQRDRRFKGLADALCGAGLLQNAVDVIPDGDERIPLCHCGVVERVLGEGLIHLVEQDVARVIAVAVGHCQPDLVAGEGEDGREHLGEGVEDDKQCGLSAAAL